MKTHLAIIALLAFNMASAQFQNGLNNTAGAPNAELGGDLIRHTNVSLFDNNGGSKYNLCFHDEGVFGVGNTLNASSLLNLNGTFSKSIFSYENNSTATNAAPFYNTLASYYKSNFTTTQNIRGILNSVDADGSGGSTNIIGDEINILGDCPTLTGSKISVTGRTWGASQNGVGIQVESHGAVANYGGIFTASSPAGFTIAPAYGIVVEARGETDNYGGFFRSDSAWRNRSVYAEARNRYHITSENYAIYGLADGTGTNTNSYCNVGVMGIADHATTSFGVAGYLASNQSYGYPNLNTAVFGSAQFASGGTVYAGYFVGNVTITGAGVIPGGTWTGSDRVFKKDIMPLTNAKDIIGKLQPKSFFYDTENEYDITFTNKKDYGIIAQDLEEVLPELVRTVSKPEVKDKSGKIISPEKQYKVVNYNAFIGILIANAKEQQKQLDEQRQLIDDLLKKSGTFTGIDNSLSQTVDFKMGQNVPNPFSGETTIKYSLLQSVNKANLIVYDLTGKQVTSFPIDQKASSIVITSENLAAGIYIYSIVADGNIVDSKRMVVAEK